MTLRLVHLLLEQTEYDPETGCINWTGSIDENGYGRYQGLGAHRVMYEAYYNTSLHTSDLIMHECDNTKCIHPCHIEKGDHSLNARHEVEIGAHSATKLTDEQVVAIRKAHASGTSQHDLASQYGIGQANIGRAVRGESYTHVQGPVRVKTAKSKLDETKVREARKLHASGISYSRLSTKYRVDVKTIREAILGITWAHVK